jgi:membrane protease YdiL (CAAX protease family)
VLSPDLPGVSWMLAGVFVLLLALLVWRAVRKDRREYQRFKRYRSTERRQAMFRKWLRESFLSFGSLSVALLAVVWQFVPLLLDDVNGWRSVRAIRAWYDSLGWLGPAITVLLVLAFVVLPMVLLFFVSKQDDVTAIGDIQALLPRNTAEVRLGALLSLNAGVVEELVFRLAVPALIYGAFGSAGAALLVSVLLFGALHAYQGTVGVIGTMLVGALLMALYVATGTILVPIVAHLLIDLRSFVLIPLIVLKVPRYPAGAGDAS